MYELEDLIFTLMPYFTIPLIVMTLNQLLRIGIKLIRSDTGTRNEKEAKEENKETKNVDDDLKKYFNYKE